MSTPQSPTPEQPGYQPPPSGYQPPPSSDPHLPSGDQPDGHPPYGTAPQQPPYPPAGQPPYPPAGQPGQYPPPSAQPPYPPAGQPSPYAPAGYQPAAPGAYQAAPDSFQPTGPAPKASNRKGLTLGLILRLGIPLVLVLIAVFWGLFQFNVKDAAVGDCLAPDGTDSVKAVKCDDPSAQYQVVAIIENQSEPTDLANPCSEVAMADASYWEGTRGGTGRMLCLREL